MNLDDLDRFKQLDTQNMLAEIDGLPDQLKSAWDLGQTHALPNVKDVQRVIVAGMGGSAIGADLAAAFVSSSCSAPVIVHRDYGLPAFARGKQTLVVASSHSGNTEETLEAFEAALKNDCAIVVISTGGELAKRAKEKNIPVWTFSHAGQPRSAVGFSFGLLLALLARLNLIPDPSKDVAEAVEAMKKTQAYLRPDVPAVKNPAKRYAGQLMGRWVTVFGAGILAPVARRFKGQMNEVAKAAANFEYLPEADHNTLAGTVNPVEVLEPHTMNLFLRAPSDHPRNRKRLDLTKEAFMLEGLNTDFLDARGDSPLAHMWTMILFGDYMAYYLAIAYGVDPTPIQALVNFKEAMKK
ncbi:MAG: bifunctional phosphoglucose/phosphomannose isomerase [Chloroflexi bacterium]|nr:bifunctional phosphoglucose/phosphomannose isomerase [Chloroflexota bacterium]MBI3338964.1 bifunctional phosphoglucose/phosphomannose isomerase [Chloroflexota bacterium]